MQLETLKKIQVSKERRTRYDKGRERIDVRRRNIYYKQERLRAITASILMSPSTLRERVKF